MPFQERNVALSLMLNTLRAPVGNMRIFIRIQIRILHVVQSADPHYTRSPLSLPTLILGTVVNMAP